MMGDDPDGEPGPTWATLRLWGPGLEPTEVSERLGIGPTTAHRTGDARGKAQIWTRNHWSLSSQGRIAETSLEAHLHWLLDQIAPHQEDLRSLLAQPGIEADLFCFWESTTGQGGPTFSPALLRRLAGLGLSLGLDIYYSDAAHAFWEERYRRLEG
jgi:hypothetical protein